MCSWLCVSLTYRTVKRFHWADELQSILCAQAHVTSLQPTAPTPAETCQKLCVCILSVQRPLYRDQSRAIGASPQLPVRQCRREPGTPHAPPRHQRQWQQRSTTLRQCCGQGCGRSCGLPIQTLVPYARLRWAPTARDAVEHGFHSVFDSVACCRSPS